ncbi:hypothetical protein FIV00_12960 [Labrenzia sp. THAF82]|uniref:SRPBCC family protein n=1 Tax=Labrenzia sp. THAF82 TaxID=2587861 RepID=UPI001267F388|nr:SRPBCC domain-containing protein [Labrenzia sp. THAF82]QFT31396.1 hypothetical protein FIV00_12960 [Labrenzia sp. THAF82]
MAGYKRIVEVDVPASAIYAAITSGVVNWWTTGSGDASEVGMVFSTRFGETYNHIKVAKLVPNECIEWDILEHYHANDTLKRDDEWTGTRILWNLIELDENRTRLEFTHEGLIESMECWDICEAGWNFFLLESLKPYLEKGEGQPFQHEQ